MTTAIVDGERGVDVVEVGQRIRRKRLHRDSVQVHSFDADRGVHEERAAVAHAAEGVGADVKLLNAVRLVESRTVRARRLEGVL